MKFSGKMCLKIILKVTKKQGFHPLFRRYIFQKTTGEGQIDPPAVLGLTNLNYGFVKLCFFNFYII